MENEFLKRVALLIEQRPDPTRTPEHHTIGDLVRVVLGVDNPEDAKAVYEGMVDYYTHYSEERSRYTPEQVAKANIGWCFGEGMTRERVQMWRESTGAAHFLGFGGV